MASLEYLVQISAHVDMNDETFKMCVEFWSGFAARLYVQDDVANGSAVGAAGTGAGSGAPGAAQAMPGSIAGAGGAGAAAGGGHPQQPAGSPLLLDSVVAQQLESGGMDDGSSGANSGGARDGRNGSPGSMRNETNDPRLRNYSAVLCRVRELLVCRMFKPPEVFFVETTTRESGACQSRAVSGRDRKMPSQSSGSSELRVSPCAKPVSEQTAQFWLIVRGSNSWLVPTTPR